MNERKYYLDNIRWITVVLVIVYHIIYIFNCSGIISNINVQGIAILDTFCIFVYPWFMCLLFVISGMATKYSLGKRSGKEFLKDRAKRILVPSLVGIFAYGWVCGLITSKYADMFAGNGDMIPGAIKYLIYSLTGIGPLWYCHVLFIASVLILLIRKIDKKDKLSDLGKKVKLWMLIPLAFVVWESSHILNTPLITVYRFGIYLLMFFLGYYIFSNEVVQDKLQKYSIALIAVTCIVGILYVIKFYGQNYAADSVLQGLFTNMYLWLAIIAILAFGKRYLNFSNKFSTYMTRNNFAFYVLHYNIVLVSGHLVVTYLNLPFALNYVIIAISTVIVLPFLAEVIKRIPVINSLLLGVKKTKKA